MSIPLMILGGAGILKNLLSDGPSYPSAKFSPETLESINFSDIKLKEMLPEVYAQILSNQQAINDVMSEASRRREGPTAQQQRQMLDDQNKMASQMATVGMAGTPIGMNVLAGARARMMEDIAARNQAAYAQMLGLGMQGQQNLVGMTQNALGQVAAQMNANRANALAIDQMRNQASMGQYQADIANRAAQNQFFTGLLGGGLQYDLGQRQLDLIASDPRFKGYKAPTSMFDDIGTTVGGWFK